MAILVTGATGFLGRHLIARLVKTKDKVRALTRGASPVPSQWHGRVEIVAGDLLDKDCVRSALQGVTTVFNLAGVVTDPVRMREVNVEGARVIAEAAGEVGVSRFIHVSSAGVVGTSGTDVVTEDTLCRPQDPYEQSKYEGERAVLESSGVSGLDSQVLRPTIVFGEGPRSGHDSLLEWMRVIQQGQFVFFGAGGIANYVYVQDVVEALCQAAAGPTRGPAVYFVADPAPLKEFVNAMAEALQVQAPERQLPVWAGYTSAALMETGRRLFALPAPLTKARVRALTTMRVYLGVQFRRMYPDFCPIGYREGLRRTVAFYRQEGLL